MPFHAQLEGALNSALDTHLDTRRSPRMLIAPMHDMCVHSMSRSKRAAYCDGMQRRRVTLRNPNLEIVLGHRVSGSWHGQVEPGTKSIRQRPAVADQSVAIGVGCQITHFVSLH